MGKEGDLTMALSEEYLHLFHAIEDARADLGRLGIELERITQQLTRAQQEAEELYIERKTGDEA